MRTIQDELRDRKIKWLVHFTQQTNLPGIVEHGLLSRGDLVERGLLAHVSNEWRLDDNDWAISLSISRLNERMFAAKRGSSGHAHWIVLVLDADILRTHRCRFCWTNAARNEIRDHQGRMDGPWALGNMFAGTDADRAGLPSNFPTNTQAEVQVMQPISPEHIRYAVLDRQELLKAVQATLSELPGLPRPVFVDSF